MLEHVNHLARAGVADVAQRDHAVVLLGLAALGQRDGLLEEPERLVHKLDALARRGEGVEVAKGLRRTKGRRQGLRQTGGTA